MSVRVLTTALAVFLCLAVLACGSSSHGSHNAYITLPGSDQVTGFRVDNKNGSLTVIKGAPFAAGKTPTAVVVHPGNQFLYVTNAGEATVSLFSIDSSGAL